MGVLTGADVEDVVNFAVQRLDLRIDGDPRESVAEKQRELGKRGYTDNLVSMNIMPLRGLVPVVIK